MGSASLLGDIKSIEKALRVSLRLAQQSVPVEAQIEIGRSVPGQYGALTVAAVLLNELPKNYKRTLTRGYRATASDIRLAGGVVRFWQNNVRSSTASSPDEMRVRSEEVKKAHEVFRALSRHVTEPKVLEYIQRRIEKIKRNQAKSAYATSRQSDYSDSARQYKCIEAELLELQASQREISARLGIPQPALQHAQPV